MTPADLTPEARSEGAVSGVTSPKVAPRDPDTGELASIFVATPEGVTMKQAQVAHRRVLNAASSAQGHAVLQVDNTEGLGIGPCEVVSGEKPSAGVTIIRIDHHTKEVWAEGADIAEGDALVVYYAEESSAEGLWPKTSLQQTRPPRTARARVPRFRSAWQPFAATS